MGFGLTSTVMCLPELEKILWMQCFIRDATCIEQLYSPSMMLT